jgi:CPA2 family monovalent cation:H+ antiporter-2
MVYGSPVPGLVQKNKSADAGLSSLGVTAEGTRRSSQVTAAYQPNQSPMMFAASVAPPFLAESAAIVIAAAAIALLSYRVGLVPIVGFLLAGVVIGPHALGLVDDPDLVNAAAEIGVILLLFTIGIEFSLTKLSRLKLLILGGGGLQVVLASAGVLAVLALAGVDWKPGLYTGFLVSLSSTAIVLKLLADRGETVSEQGQVMVGLLIFQDLAVIVMVLVVPILGVGGGSGTAIVWALGKALALIVTVLVVARRVMPPLLERVARTCSPELFLLTLIAICLGTALLTSTAGVSLSLGAFLAGLVVSESRFSHHAFGEVMPLQILFSATFFVSVGMLLDLGFLVRHLPVVAGACVLVLVVKILTTGGSVLALGYKPPIAAASALTLAQVGEFSFVLEHAGRDVGLTPAGLGDVGSQTFVASAVVLMVVTPQLAALGARLAERLGVGHARSGAAAAREPEAGPETFAHLQQHVIVAGYGDGARQLVRVLHGSRIPFVITTLSPGGANEAEAMALPVLRGDSARQHTLEAAGIERAKAVVIADDDPATALRIVAVARSLAPTARIVVRTRYDSDAPLLSHEGADRVVVDELESVLQMFADVLRHYQIGPEEIEAHEATVRSRGYAALREASATPAVVCELDPDCLDTRAVVVRDGAAIAGRSPASLVAQWRLDVTAVQRDGRALTPGDVDAFRAGDVITVRGAANAFAVAAALFRTGDTGPQPPMAAAAPAANIDLESTVSFTPHPQGACTHVAGIRRVHPSARGCEECLRLGERWVHLRICLTCGHVGCCDTSQHKHATAHYHTTSHPVMRSLEPGDQWGWCYVDEVML